jgi:hypothetical protein
MADQILQKDKILKDSDSSVVQWEMCYSVESGADTNTFVVVVEASEMTDPTDEAEAKTLANTKATALKTAWVTALANSNTPTTTSTTPDTVTL